MEFSIYYSNDFNACEIKCERCFFKRIPAEMRYDLRYPGVEGLLLGVGKKLSEMCDEETEIEFYGVINRSPYYIDKLSRVMRKTKEYFDEAGTQLRVGLHVNDIDMIKPIHERVGLDWTSNSVGYKQHEVRGDTEEDVMKAMKYAEKEDIEICLITIPDLRYLRNMEDSIQWMNELMSKVEASQLWIFPLIPTTPRTYELRVNFDKYVEWLHALDKELFFTDVEVFNYCFRTGENFKHIKEAHDCYDQMEKLEMPDFLVDIPVGCDVIPHLFHYDGSIVDPGFDLCEAKKELSTKVERLMKYCRGEDELLFKQVGKCPARFLYTRKWVQYSTKL